MFKRVCVYSICARICLYVFMYMCMCVCIFSFVCVVVREGVAARMPVEEGGGVCVYTVCVRV